MDFRGFFPKNLQFDSPPLKLGTKEYCLNDKQHSRKAGLH